MPPTIDSLIPRFLAANARVPVLPEAPRGSDIESLSRLESLAAVMPALRQWLLQCGGVVVVDWAELLDAAAAAEEVATPGFPAALVPFLWGMFGNLAAVDAHGSVFQVLRDPPADGGGTHPTYTLDPAAVGTFEEFLDRFITALERNDWLWTWSGRG